MYFYFLVILSENQKVMEGHDDSEYAEVEGSKKGPVRVVNFGIETLPNFKPEYFVTLIIFLLYIPSLVHDAPL